MPYLLHHPKIPLLRIWINRIGEAKSTPRPMPNFYCQDPLRILNFLRMRRAEQSWEWYSAKYYPLNLHLTLLFGSKRFSHIIIYRWRAKLWLPHRRFMTCGLTTLKSKKCAGEKFFGLS